MVWSLFRKKISSKTCLVRTLSKKWSCVALDSRITSTFLQAAGTSIEFSWMREQDSFRHNSNLNKLQSAKDKKEGKPDHPCTSDSNIRQHYTSIQKGLSLRQLSAFLPCQSEVQKQSPAVQTCHQKLPTTFDQHSSWAFPAQSSPCCVAGSVLSTGPAEP